jgi:lysophospholipid acyltransferase (LPLAT)-like uncharacterized protein
MASLSFELLASAVPAIAPPVARGFLSTCSLRVHGREVKKKYFDGTDGYIGVIWHQTFLMALDYFRRRKIVVMVSQSKDGELVARSLHKLGYRTVRGSSSRGGREALAELTDLVRDGWGAAIVADGPRGPAYRAKMGCVMASRNSGAPIMPVAFHAEPSIMARNWDRTMIPKPFSRITVAFGQPIYVPAGANTEKCEVMRALVDRRMEELHARCRG